MHMSVTGSRQKQNQRQRVSDFSRRHVIAMKRAARKAAAAPAGNKASQAVEIEVMGDGSSSGRGRADRKKNKQEKTRDKSPQEKVNVIDH